MEGINKQSENNSAVEFLKDCSFLGMKFTGIVASEVFSHRWIVQMATNSGLCIQNYLPQRALPYLGRLTKALVLPVTYIKNTFGLNQNQVTTSVAPLVEELQFRFLFQQIILKKVPEAVLDKLFPNHSINFDALPLKVLRVLLSATLFALAHHQYHSCEAGGGVSVFLGGALYSALIESGDSVMTTATLHMFWNQFAPIMEHIIHS